MLNPVTYISLITWVRKDDICYCFDLIEFAYVTVGRCRNVKGLNGPAPKERVLMTDGWGGRAIPQHKLIPPLHKQRQGIVGFSDSRNEILLPVCYAIKAMQHQPTETWVKAVVLLETIDFENYLLLLILTQAYEGMEML